MSCSLTPKKHDWTLDCGVTSTKSLRLLRLVSLFRQPHAIKPSPQSRSQDFSQKKSHVLFFLCSSSLRHFRVYVQNATKQRKKKYHQESPISRKKNLKITALKKEYMIPTVPVIANAPGKDGPGVVSLPLLLLIVTSRPDIPICSSAMVRHYPHILRWNLRSAVKLMVDLKGEEEPVIWDLRTGTWRLWMRSRFPS